MFTRKFISLRNDVETKGGVSDTDTDDDNVRADYVL